MPSATCHMRTLAQMRRKEFEELFRRGRFVHPMELRHEIGVRIHLDVPLVQDVPRVTERWPHQQLHDLFLGESDCGAFARCGAEQDVFWSLGGDEVHGAGSLNRLTRRAHAELAVPDRA